MADLLTGRTLLWCCWDPTRVVTALAHTVIDGCLDARRIRTRLVEAESPAEVAAVASSQTCGLAIWALRDEGDAAAACLAICDTLREAPTTYRVCYLAPQLRDYAAILTEAGAQIVVSEIPSVHRYLASLLGSAPLSPYGFHPLTSGLVARLPWSEVDAD